MMRNDTYTIYSSKEVELDNYSDSEYILRYRGASPPDASFVESLEVKNVFKKIVPKSSIQYAFSVATYAEYFGHKWQVDRVVGNKLRLSIGEFVDVPDIKMIDRGWYEVWVDKLSIKNIWEERKESGIGLPFPPNIERKQFLRLTSF